MKGRDTNYKCIYCGLFLPYDRKITAVENNMCWDYGREEPYEEFLMYHKLCKTKENKINGKETLELVPA